MGGEIENCTTETPEITFKSEVNFLVTKIITMQPLVVETMFTKKEWNEIGKIVAEYEDVHIEDIFVIPPPVKEEFMDDSPLVNGTFEVRLPFLLC